MVAVTQCLAEEWSSAGEHRLEAAKHQEPWNIRRPLPALLSLCTHLALPLSWPACKSFNAPVTECCSHVCRFPPHLVLSHPHARTGNV